MQPNRSTWPILRYAAAGKVSGVSRLHGAVSRNIFQPIFPRWPRDEVPVGHVTNGVLTPSWDSAEADALWTAHCSKDRWLGALAGLPERIRGIADADIWRCRSAARRSLVGYARERLSRHLAVSGRAAKRLKAPDRCSAKIR